jgi:CBS domain-containing protein
MKVSDVMTTEVETVQMNSTLEEVASIMKVENVGAVPVVDEDDDLVGIITDRDIVVRCVADGKDPAETNVEEVLSHDLETIEPDADVEEAAKLMADRQIRRLPVCEQGELVGMLSIGDLAVKSSDHEAPGEALREISQGVKGEVRTMPDLNMRRTSMNRDFHEGGSRAPHAVAAGFSDDEDLDLEFSEQKDLAMSEVRERHVNRHHKAPIGVKRSGNRNKSYPLSERVPKQDRDSARQNKQAAGISNQDAAEELKRNNRVIAFRKDAQVGRRKTG